MYNNKKIYIYFYLFINTSYDVHTAIHKFGMSKIFDVFKGISYAYQGCIYLIKTIENNC